MSILGAPGWRKEFADGQVEIGTDHMVRNGEASWSNGRQDDIIQAEVMVEVPKSPVVLRGLVKTQEPISCDHLEQFDVYMSQCNLDEQPHEATLLARAVGYKLTEEDLGKQFILSTTQTKSIDRKAVIGVQTTEFTVPGALVFDDESLVGKIQIIALLPCSPKGAGFLIDLYDSTKDCVSDIMSMME
jgi:hypothetical protein